jgi:hypothetical protein
MRWSSVAEAGFLWQEYKVQREQREARKDKPADVLEGLGSGSKRLAKGLFDGVLGVSAQRRIYII